jgi:transcriptional regulator with XRE-family HTH domain
LTADVAEHLGRNVRQLRAARGMTQQQMARLSGLPRATWANLESGGANPTLAVLHAVAMALQVSIEELIARPRGTGRVYTVGSLAVRRPGGVHVRRLLPDPLPGLEMERMELAPGQRFSGVPHTPGTREYLTCEKGNLVLTASGESFSLAAGDVVVFRGDQKHGYANPGTEAAVGYSIVVLAPG